MRRPTQGAAGLVGSILLAALAFIGLCQWLWHLRAVRLLFEALNIGGAIDFIVQHVNAPGWVGDMLAPLSHPLFQVALIAVGLALIYLDSRRRAGSGAIVSYPLHAASASGSIALSPTRTEKAGTGPFPSRLRVNGPF